MSDVTKRIEEYFNQKGISLRQASLAIRKNPGYLSNALNAGSSISADILSLICDTYQDLNPVYVVCGKGELPLDPAMVNEPNVYYGKESSLDKLLDKKIEERLEKSKIFELIQELLANDIEGELDKVKRKNKNGTH